MNEDPSGQASAIPYVFCFDGAFARHAAVAITSLCVHASSTCRIYCLISDVAADDITLLGGIARRFGVDISFIDVADQFRGWKTAPGYSAANYYRLLIPANVSEPKAVYLDCDLLVTCDLADLLGVELGIHRLAARHDGVAGRDSRIERPPSEPYVNTGVLVLDLDRCRADDFLEQARQVYEAHASQIQWADQCVINKVAEGQKQLLVERWNVMAHHAPLAGRSVREQLEPFVGVGVLHFSGRIKPWHSCSSSWEKTLWQGYARIAGVPWAPEDRQPQTVIDWKVFARGLEEDGQWKEAASAYKKLAHHFETKAARPR